MSNLKMDDDSCTCCQKKKTSPWMLRYVYSHPLGEPLKETEPLRGRWQLMLGSESTAGLASESKKRGDGMKTLDIGT